LSGVSVLVAGAGLAGLTAAYDLAAMGAAVTVIEARDRVGGRVWTIRDGFADRQHAEAGGDMIDDAQHEIRQLAGQLGLTLSRILRDGFGYMRSAGPNHPPRSPPEAPKGWGRLPNRSARLARRYLAGRAPLDSHHRRHHAIGGSGGG
jgi:monoamine oxidase